MKQSNPPGGSVWFWQPFLVGCSLLGGWGLSPALASLSAPPDIPTNMPTVAPVFGLRLAQTFEPPEGRGAPGRREGGGTRGGPQFDGAPPTALVPEGNLALTTLASPILYFYIPPEMVGRPAELWVTDLTETQSASVAFTLPPEPGIIGLALPADLPTLNVDGFYYWDFAITLDPDNPDADLYMYGAMMRVAPSADLLAQVAIAPPEAQPSLYASAGLWFDALNLLAMERSLSPNTFEWRRQWDTLLGSVDLGAIAPAPLLGIPDPPGQSLTPSP